MQVYYNAEFGYVVCAAADLRGGAAAVVLDPVTVLRPAASELALGNAVRSSLKRSRNAAPADGRQFPFWRVAGIGSYERFSRQFFCLDVFEWDGTLRIVPLEQETTGGYFRPDGGFYLELPAALSDRELGEAVKRVLGRQCSLAGGFGPAYAPEWNAQAVSEERRRDEPWEWEDEPPKRQVFFQVNLVLTALAAIPIWWHIREAWEYMSFAGFGSIFVLFFMMPGFLMLAAEAVLFVRAMRSSRPRYAITAHILQIICGIPSTYFFCLAPDFFLALSVYTVLMVFGAAGLIRLLVLRRR